MWRTKSQRKPSIAHLTTEEVVDIAFAMLEKMPSPSPFARIQAEVDAGLAALVPTGDGTHVVLHRL